MTSYIIKKLLYGLLVMYGVVTLIFLIFNALPGDPARMMLGQRSDPQALAAINKELGLDKPLWKQYLFYINDLSPISVHATSNTVMSTYFDPQKYNGNLLFNINTQQGVALKWPYPSAKCQKLFQWRCLKLLYWRW